jgi:hypothetical protein
VDGCHEQVLCVLADGDLVFKVVVDEFWDAVKRPAIKTVLNCGSVTTVDDLVALNEGVVAPSPPVHTQSESISKGGVLTHKEVSFFVEKCHCIITG